MRPDAAARIESEALPVDVVIKRSSSAEVARLIDALLISGPNAREAAAARLAIVGPRGLERLTATLQGLNNPDHVVAVLDVLERIGDARSAAQVGPQLRSDNAAIAVAAVAVVRRALQADSPEAAGRATDELLALAESRTAPEPVKRAALEALGDLPEDVLTALRARLGGDSPGATAGAAAAGPASGAGDHDWSSGHHAALDADAVHRALVKAGATAPLPDLHRLIERLRQAEHGASGERRAKWRNLRGMAHQVLAERGSRVALYDLRETVEREVETLPVTMLAALNAIGDASCVEPIAEAWARSSDAWVKQQLKDALQAIIIREALSRRHGPIKRLAARHPDLLRTLSTPSQTRP